ncbi:hypothetical protein IH992_11180 [Candidatus Poribacteria bacterium]|nr:hypothetical protein [Candidatus Poribacteria bacterium]
MKFKSVIWRLSVFMICITPSTFAQVNWTSIGPGAGSFLMASAIQPDNSDVIYLGGDIEGVFKTTDGGESWRMMTNGLAGGNRPAGTYASQELVIDPTDFQTLYVCTWSGLYKSAESWEFIFPTFIDEDEIPPVSFVAVHPNNGQILYAGIGDADHNSDGTGSLYRSEDGGTTWDLLDVGMDAEAVVHGIVVASTRSPEERRLFVSTNDGVFRSLDNGTTWTRINAGLPHSNARRLAYHISNDQLVLFLTMKTQGDSANPDSFSGGIYKSVDEGDNWVSITGDLPALPYEDPTDPPPFYDYWKFAIHPTNPDIIYIASNIGGWEDLSGIHKTIDGGQHWTKIDNKITYGWLDNVWWNDENASILEIAPSHPDILIVAGDAHLHKTTNAGQTWEQVYTRPVGNAWRGNGIELMVTFDVGFHPTDANILYVAYDDMGLFRSDDGAISFARMDEVQLDELDAVNSIAVDTATGDLYVGRNGGTNDEAEGYRVGQVWKSLDKGESWTVFSDGLPEGRPVLVMDNNNGVLYAAIYGQGVYKTSDGGQSWSNASNGLGSDAVFVWTLVIDSTNSQTLYLGLNTLEGAGHGGIYKTSDGGQNWTRLDGIPSDDVLSLTVNPSNGQVVYAGMTDDYSWSTKGGLYKSEDGGSTWTQILDQPRVAVTLVHPTQTDVIFAVSQPWWNYTADLNSGLYRSLDGGQNWDLISENLGNTFILFARINPHNPNQIYVGTHGSGLWIGENILTGLATPKPATPWDVNSDGVVNVFDLVLVGSQFGQSGTGLSGDVNGDSVVNVFDLVIVSSHFGETTVATAPSLASNKQAVKNEKIRRALAELEGLADRPHGATIAIEALRAWLTNANPIVTETKLLRNYPNPFNPETWMPYQLASDAEVEIAIYDIKGALVRQLVLGHRATGYYVNRERAAYWDGRSNTGELVSSGLYFYQLTAGDFTAVKRMAILK